MPKPYEFKSEEELVEMLKQPKTLVASQNFFAQISPTIDDVVITGVAGNTFRAFRKLPVQPSTTFRDWAKNYIQDTFTTLSQISNNTEYSKYIDQATLSLCDKWRELTNSEMGYGRGAKLFNLVLKKFACLQSLSSEQKNKLISLQHIPLDSYTIIGLRLIAPELSIPKNATMKFIETHEQYILFQEKITAIANKANVPPIYYDILAWDMGH
jgi:hypothetical protein